ncbi:hypothetical protein COJ96_10855 [Bacillus sp. AFS073361]|uniref:hypothetical protein n=1 Tax=Bacillus sp. AFS073361 TaxID=2033511 RepID=UPI000BFA8CC3|nr:hypothetical protein [Bacillus sp. AFS073361]PFP29395.1 hypothetical protein COJ96_10855 [Bacillus sp. AFS073361]
MAKNKVIAGDYEGFPVHTSFGVTQITTGFVKGIELTKNNVETYEILDETKRKSAASAVGRAFVGGVILGPVGWLAGLSAKSKGTHIIAVEFKDGKRSLLEVDDKIRTAIVKKLF